MLFFVLSLIIRKAKFRSQAVFPTFCSQVFNFLRDREVLLFSELRVAILPDQKAECLTYADTNLEARERLVDHLLDDFLVFGVKAKGGRLIRGAFVWLSFGSACHN
jgi:hypothetical protein